MGVQYNNIKILDHTSMNQKELIFTLNTEVIFLRAIFMDLMGNFNNV
jgi:hypothetical protein